MKKDRQRGKCRQADRQAGRIRQRQAGTLADRQADTRRGRQDSVRVARCRVGRQAKVGANQRGRSAIQTERIMMDIGGLKVWRDRPICRLDRVPYQGKHGSKSAPMAR